MNRFWQCNNFRNLPHLHKPSGSISRRLSDTLNISSSPNFPMPAVCFKNLRLFTRFRIKTFTYELINKKKVSPFYIPFIDDIKFSIYSFCLINILKFDCDYLLVKTAACSAKDLVWVNSLVLGEYWSMFAVYLLDARIPMKQEPAVVSFERATTDCGLKLKS
ncbi:hypothetical protein BpHYR1_013649 [Brachionus plicatilis]|uniref:Uncharacterized protein n=1 Tax=Brachionus plicatilis TaxID=10195 RepID=A0A3M7SX64_BRAPC|nr:hypothetical protein BpHYR1_013649 [Brachionus plicatilis]